jgi:tetratricopeptide (TPR) repeat protein
MEEAASTATSLNPKNSENWLGEGNIYDNLVILGVEGADELAISYYQKAGEFDPQNPLVPFFLGRLHKRLAEKNIADSANQQEESAKKQLEEKANQNFVLTLEDLNKSVSLKPNFSSAYYFLAQTYEEKGEKEKALANYQIVLQLEPGNEEIKKKVEELTK